MRRIIEMAVVAALLAVLAGCAGVLMPYSSEPSCKKCIADGYCGSVSEVYNAVSKKMYDKGGF